MISKIPGPLWIAIVSLSLMVLGKLIAMFFVGPDIFIDALVSGILLYGLYKGHKWAYFLTFVGVALSTIIFLNISIQQGLSILVLDCLVLVPVIICTDYYYPKKAIET